MKPLHYYIFWGTCTIGVLLGQLYVGTGYRLMVQSVNNLTEVFTMDSKDDSI